MLKVEAESQSAREFGTRCLLALLEKYEGVRDLQKLWIEILVRTQKAQHSCAQVPVGILAELTAKKFQGHSRF